MFINEETYSPLSQESLPTAGWHLARTRGSLPSRSLSSPPTVSYTPPIFRLQGKAHLMTIAPFPESRGDQMNADIKSLLQHHSSKASVLQCSAFFIVQLSHPYMTTGKTIALRLLIFLPAILIPACASSSPAFLMMYSA